MSDRPAEDDALVQLRRRLQAESADSMALLRDLQDNPICTVSLERSIPCVAVTWKRYATSTQFRFINESVLQLLCEHKVRKVMGDDTSLVTIHTEDRNWLIESWLPRAAASGLKAVASKSPQGYFGRLSVLDVQSGAPRDVLFRTFDDLDEARRWLKDVVA